MNIGPLHSFADHCVPCAACYISARGAVVMIPAQLPAHHPGPGSILWISDDRTFSF